VHDASVVTFDSVNKALTADIQFDERGNVKEGGDPDISFYHIVEFNGEIVDEPTHGSDKLMEAIEKGDAYEVKFAPPRMDQFQCTEKVLAMHAIMEAWSHELSEKLIERAVATLADEGISNSKQLGEVDEKDYDAIHLPALIKSRLRKIRAESRKQADVAENKVEMDGAEVQAELDAYMQARDKSKGGTAEANSTEHEVVQDASKPAAVAGVPPPEEEEDGTFKSLVWAVMNCPTCKGKETIACFRSCRYSEEGKVKPWGDCLNECIENRWLRATFWAMLPKGS